MTIKYQEGYIVIPTVGIVPKPYQLWAHPRRIWLTAIYIMFSMVWALEIVSHLEELCFWLFLINVGAAQTSRFSSCLWIGLPVLAVLMRADPLKTEAWTIFAGSIGSLIVTLWFLRVLAFLRRVKNEGDEPEVVVRLSTFHKLNIIRVMSRFIFVLPLPSHNHVNESVLDRFVGHVGCDWAYRQFHYHVAYLLPRSIAKEAGYKPRQKTPSQNSRGAHIGSKNNQNQRQQLTSTPQDVKDPSIYDAPAPEPTYTPPLKRDVEDQQPRVRLAPIDRAAATGGGVWEIVDYRQYQQHGAILPTIAPR
ncbi:hypothetical protein FRC10_010684, partial [Ceratobasidium sp. 414]